MAASHTTLLQYVPENTQHPSKAIRPVRSQFNAVRNAQPAQGKMQIQ